MKNSELIDSALREINVINENGSASAEQGEQCLDKLNALMAKWRVSDADFGWWKQTDLTADAPVPDWAEEAVISALAVRVAPQYGASISAELALVARDSLKTVKREVIKLKMDNADMSHMPIGAGHYQTRYDIQSDS
jgi:hypothetical protein